jgi:GNAT superfamily N-acetyltransferase
MMKAYHPAKAEDYRARDQLLQLCLRPEPLPFPIRDEYPIVLSEEGLGFSYCKDHNNRLCSHANLWPRSVIDRQKRQKGRVGLIGNVATDPGMRGRGHMRELLSDLEDIAVRQGLSALILWSDLDSFYHKLGYESLGQELHLGFAKSDKNRPSAQSFRGQFILNGELSATERQAMLSLRPSLPLTLERSAEEFQLQMSIPWLDCFCAYRDGELTAFLLVGKGYDMVGVIHEWGASDLTGLMALIDYAATTLPFESIMLLVPEHIDTEWTSSLVSLSESHERRPMALVKYLYQKQKREDYSSLFVWGLDSI